MRTVLKLLLPFAIGTELGLGLFYLGVIYFPSIALQYTDAEFISDLGLIMCLEFIIAHSATFFTIILGANINKLGGNFKRVHRYGLAGLLFMMYLIFAGAIGGIYGVYIFTLLTISRCYFFLIKKEFSFKVEVIKSFSRAGIYVLSVLILLVSEISFGVYDESLKIDNMGGDLTPLNFLNWGAVYFCTVGVVTLAIDIYLNKKQVIHNVQEQ